MSGQGGCTCCVRGKHRRQSWRRHLGAPGRGCCVSLARARRRARRPERSQRLRPPSCRRGHAAVYGARSDFGFSQVRRQARRHLVGNMLRPVAGCGGALGALPGSASVGRPRMQRARRLPPGASRPRPAPCPSPPARCADHSAVRPLLFNLFRSCGVILFKLLFGQYPFKEDKDFARRIVAGQWAMPQAEVRARALLALCFCMFSGAACGPCMLRRCSAAGQQPRSGGWSVYGAAVGAGPCRSRSRKTKQGKAKQAPVLPAPPRRCRWRGCQWNAETCCRACW